MTSPNGNRKAPRTSNGKHAEDDWIAQAMRYKEQVLPFVLSLHHEGFSFSEILREVQNEKVLKNIYAELGLPLSKQVPVVSTTADSMSAGNDQTTHRALPAVDRAATTLVVGTGSPKAAAPVDRSEYLARLSQLKAAKSATATSKEPSKAKPVMSKPLVRPAPQTMVTKATSIPDVSLQIVKEQDVAQNKKLNTERLKQKLEILKAAEQKKRELAAAQAKAPAPSEASESGNTGTGTGTPTQISVAATDSTSAKKRPVASDFFIAEAETPSFSRPFGQSRHNSDDDAMIIEASDDESDNTDEADNEALPSSNDTAGFSNAQSTRQQHIGNFPPLTDFPPRSPFNRQSSNSNIRTPAAQTPNAMSEAEALLKHEQELAMLKIRIAEAERRKKGTANKSGVVSDAVTGEVLQDIHSAVMQQAQTVAGMDSSGNATPLASSELGSSIDSDKRSLLRAKLSARDIAASAKKARLAEMQRQVELLQQEYEQDMLEQDQLREELEAFNVDTEGMSKEEMEAKKDEIVQQLELETESAQQQSAMNPITPRPDDIESPIALDVGTAAEQAAEVDISSHISEPANGDDAIELVGADESAGQVARPIEDEASNSSSGTKADTDDDDDDSQAEAATEHIQPGDHDQPDPKQTADVGQQAIIEDSDDEEVDMDMEDTSDESSGSSSDEDSADESSGDSSDDNVPATTVITPSPALNGVDEPTETSEDSDGDAPMDVSDDESDDESNDEAEVETNEASSSSKEPSVMQTSLHSTSVSTPIPADDIAPELQYLEHPTERSTLHDTHGTPFVPYEGSILQQFKQFRSHPEYTQEVQGGYRSLKYSNNIDAHKMLCPDQGSDDACQDPRCPYQHFRDMSLPGAY